MKDRKPLHFFLGMEVSRVSNGLRLTQSKYVVDLLAKADLVGAKPVSSPLTSGSKFSAYEGDPLPDATLYRQLVGALKYRTLTRPYITYAVNQVCQFMHAPTLAIT